MYALPTAIWLAWATLNGGSFGDAMACLGIGLLFACIFLTLFFHWRATWKQMLAEPQLLAITATLRTLAASLSLASAKVLESRHVATPPPIGPVFSGLGPPSYTLLMLAPMLVAAACLLLILYNTRKWHLELSSAVREFTLQESNSQEVQFRSLCSQYPEMDAYISDSFWETIQKRPGFFVDSISTLPLKRVTLSIAAKTEEMAEAVLNWTQQVNDRIRHASPQTANTSRGNDRVLLQLLPAGPTLSAFFFGKADNALHAILISCHPHDREHGQWISIGNRDSAGQLRQTFRATFPMPVPPSLSTNQRWLTEMSAESAHRYEDRWKDLNKHQAVVSRTKFGVRQRLAKLAADSRFKTILGIDLTDLDYWLNDDELKEYLKNQIRKNVYRLFIVDSPMHLTKPAQDTPGNILRGHTLVRVLKLQEEAGIKIGVLFKVDAKPDEPWNLDLALFIESDAVLERLDDHTAYVNFCENAESVLYIDKAIGAREGLAGSGQFQADPKMITESFQAFETMWNSVRSRPIYEGDSSAGRLPSEVAAAVIRHYLPLTAEPCCPPDVDVAAASLSG